MCLSSHLRLGLGSSHFLSTVPIKILFVFLTSPRRDACPNTPWTVKFMKMHLVRLCLLCGYRLRLQWWKEGRYECGVYLKSICNRVRGEMHTSFSAKGWLEHHIFQKGLLCVNNPIRATTNQQTEEGHYQHTEICIREAEDIPHIH
jgi:hypothetical protein